MKTKKILSYFLILLFAAGITACSDNGSGTDEEQGNPPSIPNLSTKAQPDISYFQNNNAKGAAASATQNFSIAKTFVLSTSTFALLSQSYFGYLNSASPSNADFNNGQWVWDYSYSQAGVSVSVKTIAEPNDSGYDWATFVSFDDGQGNSYSDLKLIEGVTGNGGDQAEWSFFAPTENGSGSIVAYTSSWTIMSDTERTLAMEIFDDGALEGNIKYDQDNAEHTLVFEDLGSASSVIEVYWNTEANVGYMTEDGEMICWNDSFQDVACTEVGF